MRKHILALLLCFSAIPQVSAEKPNSVFLLEQQCFKFPAFELPTPTDETLTHISYTLEKQLITLHNLRDSINYFHSRNLTKDAKKSLLNCKLNLAEKFNQLINSPSFTALISQLQGSTNSEYYRLAEQLTKLKYNHLTTNEKSQFYPAQASFRENLSTQALSLNIIDPKCRLDYKNMLNQKDNTQKKNINVNVASYLLHQANEPCRKSVWLTYQNRADHKNEQQLNQVLKVRQQQAKRHEFENYADMMISNTYLQNPFNVLSFLNGELEKNVPAPWNIGNALKAIPKQTIEHIETQKLLKALVLIIRNLGIKTENPKKNVIRLWDQQFLLGDIYLIKSTQTNKISYSVMMKSVISQQFGKSVIIFPETLNKSAQAKKLVFEFARAMSDLTAGSQFYLNNSLSSSKQIGLYWLNRYLNHQLSSKFAAFSDENSKTNRDAVITSYKKQLNVVNSLIALNLYANMAKNAVFNANSEKDKSIYQKWSIANWSPYGINDIVVSGALSFESVWDQSLADYIFKQTFECQPPEFIYNTLLINEQQQSLKQILINLIGEPVAPRPLIRRIQHAASYQSHTLGACPINF